ncbi:MAG: ASCH domain-containing protein [Christensenellales bacterium]
MTHQQLWSEYVKSAGIDPATPYDPWQYGGGDPDELLRLTLDGVKTATASVYDMYAIDNSPLPQNGCYSVILDSEDNARCVIRTVSVTVCPFNQVTDRQAYLEGEGDRSLAYWRAAHQECFTRELREDYGMEFRADMLIVCEEFEVTYRV